MNTKGRYTKVLETVQEIGTEVKATIKRLVKAGRVNIPAAGKDNLFTAFALESIVILPGGINPQKETLEAQHPDGSQLVFITINGQVFNLDKRESLLLAEYLLQISENLANRPGATYKTF